MISTSDKVAVIDTTLGMEVLCFPNRLQAVLVMMESARIAPKHEHYGCPAHEAAIRKIREHCEIVLKAIEDDRALDAAIARGEIVPEQA